MSDRADRSVRQTAAGAGLRAVGTGQHSLAGETVTAGDITGDSETAVMAAADRFGNTVAAVASPTTVRVCPVSPGDSS